jgi:hypothetical protein
MEMLEKFHAFIQAQFLERYFNGSGLSLRKTLFLDIHLYRTKFAKGSVTIYDESNNKRKEQ